MSSTLSEGVRVPDIGSVNWGADVNFNWGLLNTALANISGNVKTDVANTWTATQTFSETISGSITRAVGDEDGNNIKSALAGKQSSLSQSQLDACNSGITASAVQQIGTNASNISGLQTAVSSKAADNAVVHLAGAETISGDKTFTGAVVTHNITPETDNTYSLGTASKRWTDLYASKNISIYEDGLTFGTVPTASAYFGFRYYDSTGNVYGDMLFNSNSNGSNFLRLRCRNTDGTNTYDRQVQISVKRDGTTQFLPNNSGVTELGTSGNKWKSLNGINPGALSFPSTPTVDIDTTNWDKRATNGVIGSITPSMDGWLNVQIQRDVDFAVWPIGSYRQLFRAGAQSNGKYLVMIMIPVTKNVTTSLYTVPLGVSESDLTFGIHRFYPCLGNV